MSDFRSAIAVALFACALAGAIRAEEPAPPVPLAKAAPDLDKLQGRWRAVSIAEGDRAVVPESKDAPLVEFCGGTLTLSYKEPGDTWKRQVYKITLGETKTHKTIDLFHTTPPGRGIYEWIDPGEKPTRLRLALATGRKCPDKFGGDGVVVYELVALEMPAVVK